jgi:hypothetical protein
MILDDCWSHNQLHYELAFRVPSYDDGSHLFRFVINSMTCDQECVINSAPTFTYKSIQCLHYIDKNEREKDVLFFLDQQMQRNQDVDFLVDDATILGFGQDCNVESKYECMKTRFKSSRIVKTTEGSFLMEAIFECDGYRELAV